MFNLDEKLKWFKPKSVEERRQEILALTPSGDGLSDLKKIMDIVDEHPTPYKKIEEMDMADILMMFEIVRVKFTAEKEVTLEEENKLIELIEFYQNKAVTESINKEKKK